MGIVSKGQVWEVKEIRYTAPRLWTKCVIPKHTNISSFPFVAKTRCENGTDRLHPSGLKAWAYHMFWKTMWSETGGHLDFHLSSGIKTRQMHSNETLCSSSRMIISWNIRPSWRGKTWLEKKKRAAKRKRAKEAEKHNGNTKKEEDLTGLDWAVPTWLATILSRRLRGRLMLLSSSFLHRC